jgi:hypothetical protein
MYVSSNSHFFHGKSKKKIVSLCITRYLVPIAQTNLFSLEFSRNFSTWPSRYSTSETTRRSARTSTAYRTTTYSPTSSKPPSPPRANQAPRTGFWKRTPTVSTPFPRPFFHSTAKASKTFKVSRVEMARQGWVINYSPIIASSFLISK